jgi:hypothetical protein
MRIAGQDTWELTQVQVCAKIEASSQPADTGETSMADLSTYPTCLDVLLSACQGFSQDKSDSTGLHVVTHPTDGQAYACYHGRVEAKKDACQVFIWPGQNAEGKEALFLGHDIRLRALSTPTIETSTFVVEQPGCGIDPGLCRLSRPGHGPVGDGQLQGQGHRTGSHPGHGQRRVSSPPRPAGWLRTDRDSPGGGIGASGCLNNDNPDPRTGRTLTWPGTQWHRADH